MVLGEDEDLGLAGEAAERGRPVQDPVPVPLEAGAAPVGLLGVLPGARRHAPACAPGASWASSRSSRATRSNTSIAPDLRGGVGVGPPDGARVEAVHRRGPAPRPCRSVSIASPPPRPTEVRQAAAGRWTTWSDPSGGTRRAHGFASGRRRQRRLGARVMPAAAWPSPERRVGRGEPGERHPVRRAGHVVEADLVAEVHRRGIAAVLAADARASGPDAPHDRGLRPLDELPDARRGRAARTG